MFAFITKTKSVNNNTKNKKVATTFKTTTGK